MTLILLLTAIGATVIVSVLFWQSSRAALETVIQGQLAATMHTKAGEISAFFRAMRGQVTTLTEDEMIISAMVSFNRNFEDLNGQPIPTEWETALENYYVETFFSQLRDRVVGELEFEGYRPGNQAAYYA
ncbi:MAG: hypothetical protein SGJ24_15935 [Chloroflexota bacterium]|nr:hypothetical protein [Chloroflexota bacterium]